ncbi:toxin-antitoxin system HicB family antitoxin [Streptomyces sp. NBC_00154]|uniref:toxin-antitoxin system HicB family antitoxin n=1 Tax=Streptomyces sp. NBC_00154 TaxID=2975670 RepID=UPI002256316E|nr:toxin-antitoxin system HicB family antitoxin [Streptomyces sp. NBC_00154]MCX5318116.1 toxin-antitoxin system HicB family antitoxin [Streptomyces sp. NBC_00154]
MAVMTLRIPDDIDPSIRAGANAAGLSLNAYIVRAARRQAVLDAAQQLAQLGLGDDLCDEGDTL